MMGWLGTEFMSSASVSTVLDAKPSFQTFTLLFRRVFPKGLRFLGEEDKQYFERKKLRRMIS